MFKINEVSMINNTKSIDIIIYKENKFIFLEQGGECCKVYLDLLEKTPN